MERLRIRLERVPAGHGLARIGQHLLPVALAFFGDVGSSRSELEAAQRRGARDARRAVTADLHAELGPRQLLLGDVEA